MIIAVAPTLADLEPGDRVVIYKCSGRVESIGFYMVKVRLDSGGYIWAFPGEIVLNIKSDNQWWQL